MAKVFRQNENGPWKSEELELMIKKFHRKTIEERIVANARERSYYTKPSERRRREEQERKKKIRRANSRRDYFEPNRDI